MTEPDEDTLAPTTKPGATKPVVFKGRTIETIEPTEEQFLAMVRLTRLPRSTEEGMTGHRMLATLNRVPDLVRALCANEVDAEWFEDSLVNGKVKILELPEFCGDVIVEWWGSKGDENRATKRAVKRAKPAGARLAR
jgi:hypothetical protein